LPAAAFAGSPNKEAARAEEATASRRVIGIRLSKGAFDAINPGGKLQGQSARSGSDNGTGIIVCLFSTA
jgi:hypothetical protein